MTEIVGNTKKILIVVDVQNCFLFNEFQRGPGDFLNSSGDEETIKMVKEIGDLYRDHKENGFTIFTRDAHPLNHKSFNSQNLEKPDPNAPWPNHCRMEYSCNDSNTNESIAEKNPKSTETLKTLFEKYPAKKTKIESIFGNLSDINSEYPIIGNRLSYLFNFDPDLKEVLTDLDTVKQENTISIKSLIDKQNANISDLDMTTINYPETEKKYVQLLKGQRCEEDANSAFNYHIGYKTKKGFYDSLENRYSKDSSTGLWEFLIKKFPTQNLEITVCGMVGNVCVIFTVTEGMLMWERVYKTESKKDVKFNFSMDGTIFLPDMYPKDIVIRPKINVFIGNFGIKRISSTELIKTDKNTGDIIPDPRILPKGFIFNASINNNMLEGTITTPEKENYTFNILPYKNQQQGGKRRNNLCPKCKKNPYHGGKCFICGFIPFLGKTKTQKSRRVNGKKTRKNKRRFSRRRS